MKRILPLLLVLFSLSVVAQDELPWKEASKESQAYHEYRIKTTTPPYSLAKVQALIKKIKYDEENEIDALNKKSYDALSLREKFTYSMVHGESFSQNCDAMPPIQEEQKKIFAYLPDMFNEYTWSERQTKFLKDNKDSVIAWIKESVARTKRIGVNYKYAIVETKAKEIIPFLIETYNATKKDKDILTLLMQLMRDGEYGPFLKSASYKKLYGEDADYLTYLDANTANEELIIKRATDFYNGVN
ncbi:MAG: hypothetical protein WDN26_15695 [Chitinophagaceae bacterium]